MQTKKLNLESIDAAMTNLGLNQSNLAKKLNVSRESVSQWLKGKKYPQPRLLLALSKILKLTFNELVIKPQQNQPLIAYRTNRNKKVSEEAKQAGEYMGETLRVLLPYLKHYTIFAPPVIKNPSSEYVFIQKVVAELRARINWNNEELGFGFIMELYRECGIVLIPVMWGEKGHDGLCIHLPDISLTFVYANLEKVITDFKFWLLHERAHAMTPELTGEESENFANSFAGAMLFPEYLAEKHYNNLVKIKNTGMLIEQIKSIARSLLISPYTVIKELNNYAANKNLPEFKIDIGGALTNYNKQIIKVSELLFEKSRPDAGMYINKCIEAFKTPFFHALKKYLREEYKEAGIVQRLLNIPIADAKGVYKALVNE